MIRWDKFTIKAQEAIQEAQEIAEKKNHQEITPEHLLLALLREEGGIVSSILKNLGVDRGQIINQVEEHVDRLPKVFGGGQLYISPGLKRVLDLAQEEASNLKDEYISTEHLLLLQQLLLQLLYGVHQ